MGRDAGRRGGDGDCCKARDIAAGVALNGADLATDPQLAERGFFAPVKLPDDSFHPRDGRADAPVGDPGSIRTVAPKSAKTTTTSWASCWVWTVPSARH